VKGSDVTAEEVRLSLAIPSRNRG